MIEISVGIYSYKNPDLVEVVENIFNTSSMAVHVSVYDQHPMLRKSKFSHLHNVEYSHIFWDEIKSPISFKNQFIHTQEIESKYTMLLSDDILLSQGWDKVLSGFAEKAQVGVSGYGNVSLEIKDKYYIRPQRKHSDAFSPTVYLDTDLLFLKTEDARNLDCPTHLKYYGENEYLSIDAFSKDIQVWSAPSSIVDKDLNNNTLETVYTTFSIEHKYNTVIDLLQDNLGQDWGWCAGIDTLELKKIPDQYDDVLYDPYQMKIVDVGGERFIGAVKAIY